MQTPEFGLRRELSSGEAPPKELIRPEVAEVLLKWKNPFVELNGISAP
jgi:ATP sulfurylase